MNSGKLLKRIEPEIHSGYKRGVVIGRLFRIISHPRSISRDIIRDDNICYSLWIVLGFGILLSIIFLVSHLKSDYPPPDDEFRLWIETWGEFSMMPFLNVPADKYRLTQAIFMLPLIVVIWNLMAGSARLLSKVFGGKVSYSQYLNLYGYSFFIFWIIASMLDMIYSGIFGELVHKALLLEYGKTVKTMVTFFPPVMWTVLLGTGGVYNAIVTKETEGFSSAKSATVGIVTFVWPIVLISLLVR